MVLVGVAHHPLHGGVVILHPPAPLSSGRGGGAAKEKAHTPPAGVAAAGSASNGGHGCPPAPGGGAAAGAQTARGGGETGGVRHGRRDRRISQVWMLERDDFFLFERGWSGMDGRKRNVWASLLIGNQAARLSETPTLAPPRLLSCPLPKLTDGGRGAGVPAGAQGGAEARRRGRLQAALPGLRCRRVLRPRRHGGRRQGEAAARRGLRLPPHQRPSPQGWG